MKKIAAVAWCVLGLGGTLVVPWSWAEEGRVVDFVIEDNGHRLLQQALLQDRKICVEKVGGDPVKDMLFDASTRTLFIVDHGDRSYYHIDQEVIDKAASLVESLSRIVEDQQGVFADLLQTLGFSKDPGDTVVVDEDTRHTMTVADLRCTVFRQFRDGALEWEMCVSSRDSLSALGSHYETLNTFYVFGSQLLDRAGNLLSNMGVVLPRAWEPRSEGLPILVHSVGEGMRTRLTGIRSQEDLAADCLVLPSGYTRASVPFVG